MKTIELEIKIEPVAQARPRIAFIGGKAHSYLPERTKTFQDYLRNYLQQYKDQCFPANIPIKLTCQFFRTKSKYLPKRETMPFRKSDLDNYCKATIDGLNGILVADDAQITTLIAYKRWTDRPYPYIKIKLEGDLL